MTDDASGPGRPNGDRPPARASVDSVVAIENVTRTFVRAGESISALGPISLEIGHREFVSLIGPSGCGKSTLLNVVAGLLPPSTGRVVVSGREVDGTPAEIGMMLQDAVLLDWRTAVQNVLLPIEIGGGRRAVRKATPRARDLLAVVGLTGFEDTYPDELSGGMQQRVAICRMLIADPEVLLLDEPFGALDEITREYMNVELERIFHAQGKAALFVTHNIQESVFLSDRVLVMTERPGRISGIVEVDLPRPRDPDVVTTPAFQELVRQTRAFLNLGSGRYQTSSVDSPRIESPP
jgi:NitT/TauT family transport system ATP-binding protein